MLLGAKRELQQELKDVERERDALRDEKQGMKHQVSIHQRNEVEALKSAKEAREMVRCSFSFVLSGCDMVLCCSLLLSCQSPLSLFFSFWCSLSLFVAFCCSCSFLFFCCAATFCSLSHFSCCSRFSLCCPCAFSFSPFSLSLFRFEETFFPLLLLWLLSLSSIGQVEDLEIKLEQQQNRYENLMNELRKKEDKIEDLTVENSQRFTAQSNECVPAFLLLFLFLLSFSFPRLILRVLLAQAARQVRERHPRPAKGEPGRLPGPHPAGVADRKAFQGEQVSFALPCSLSLSANCVWLFACVLCVPILNGTRRDLHLELRKFVGDVSVEKMRVPPQWELWRQQLANAERERDSAVHTVESQRSTIRQLQKQYEQESGQAQGRAREAERALAYAQTALQEAQQEAQKSAGEAERERRRADAAELQWEQEKAAREAQWAEEQQDRQRETMVLRNALREVREELARQEVEGDKARRERDVLRRRLREEVEGERERGRAREEAVREEMAAWHKREGTLREEARKAVEGRAEALEEARRLEEAAGRAARARKVAEKRAGELAEQVRVLMARLEEVVKERRELAARLDRAEVQARMVVSMVVLFFPRKLKMMMAPILSSRPPNPPLVQQRVSSPKAVEGHSSGMHVRRRPRVAFSPIQPESGSSPSPDTAVGVHLRNAGLSKVTLQALERRGKGAGKEGCDTHRKRKRLMRMYKAELRRIRREQEGGGTKAKAEEEGGDHDAESHSSGLFS